MDQNTSGISGPRAAPDILQNRFSPFHQPIAFFQGGLGLRFRRHVAIPQLCKQGLPELWVAIDVVIILVLLKIDSALGPFGSVATVAILLQDRLDIFDKEELLVELRGNCRASQKDE